MSLWYVQFGAARLMESSFFVKENYVRSDGSRMKSNALKMSRILVENFRIVENLWKFRRFSDFFFQTRFIVWKKAKVFSLLLDLAKKDIWPRQSSYSPIMNSTVFADHENHLRPAVKPKAFRHLIQLIIRANRLEMSPIHLPFCRVSA